MAPNKMKYSEYKDSSDLDKSLSELTYDIQDPTAFGYEPDFDLNCLSATAIGPKVEHPPAEWPAREQRGKKSLIVLMRHLVENHELTDVRILIGEFTFYCHRLVLHCYSKFFRARHGPTGSPIEYRLPDDQVTGRAFVMIYDWMLAYKPVLQRACFVDVFRAAQYLEVTELQKQCWNCLQSSAGMRDNIAFDLFLEAKQAKFNLMDRFLLGRISRYFLPLAGTQKFLTLTCDELMRLLSSDAVAVNNEMEVLCSAVLWLFVEWPERRKYVLQVLGTVRFNLMPSWYLSSLAKRVQCERMRTIFSIDHVQQLLIPYIHYTTSLKNRTISNQQMAKFFMARRTRIHGPRRWIFDESCPYHHHVMCSRLPSLTVLMFEENCKRLLSPEWRNAWQNFTLVTYPDTEEDGDSVSAPVPESNIYGDQVRTLTQCPNHRCPGHVSNTRLPWKLMEDDDKPLTSKAARAASSSKAARAASPPKAVRSVSPSNAPSTSKAARASKGAPTSKGASMSKVASTSKAASRQAQPAKKDAERSRSKAVAAAPAVEAASAAPAVQAAPAAASRPPQSTPSRSGHTHNLSVSSASQSSNDTLIPPYPWRRVKMDDIYSAPPKRRPAALLASRRARGAGGDESTTTQDGGRHSQRRSGVLNIGGFAKHYALKPVRVATYRKAPKTDGRPCLVSSTSTGDTDAAGRRYKAVRSDSKDTKQRPHGEKVKIKQPKHHKHHLIPQRVDAMRDEWRNTGRTGSMVSECD